jgi:hypothetical protein
MNNEEDLINDTLFKIMLTDDKTEYPYINIYNDELGIDFNSSYESGKTRDKAIEHLKSLLIDSNEIEIIDSYLFSQFNSTQWSENFEIIKKIIPKKRVKLKLVSNLKAQQSHRSALSSYCRDWQISYLRFDKNKIHDRYIKTDSLIILISSGLNYLKDTDKDLTYIVKEK